MHTFYNKHYIRIDKNNNIIDGWSDGPQNNRPVTEEDILINDKGGYQFRLIIDGEQTEENPPLFDGMTIIPLYKWDGEKVVKRDSEEIEAEKEAIEEKQRKSARIEELKKMLEDTDYAVIKIAEGAATQEYYADIIQQREGWRKEINELES